MRDPGQATKTAIRGPHDEVNDFHLGLIKAYNQIEPHLHNRQILPDGKGIMYSDGAVNILWSLAEHQMRIDEGWVAQDMVSGERFEGTSLHAHPKRIYRLTFH